jgi:hypothetical protein
LLHEAQVCPKGAAGSSQYWIEHLELQSKRPDLRNVYDNLIYTCRRCNLARSHRPRVDGGGRRLLDPCVDVWTAHFTYDGDQLMPTTPDAEYTSEAYDINSPTKVALRRDRREAIDESLHVLAIVPQLLNEVMTGISFVPSRDQKLRLDLAEQLHRALAAARRTLTQLAAVPHDANEDCVCDSGACELPVLAGTTFLHLDLESGRQ